MKRSLDYPLVVSSNNFTRTACATLSPHNRADLPRCITYKAIKPWRAAPCTMGWVTETDQETDLVACGEQNGRDGNLEWRLKVERCLALANKFPQQMRCASSRQLRVQNLGLPWIDCLCEREARPAMAVGFPFLNSNSNSSRGWSQPPRRNGRFQVRPVTECAAVTVLTGYCN
jgi:hypothetical protein